MKTIRLYAAIVLAAVALSSCNEEYNDAKMHTTINSDGTCSREISFNVSFFDDGTWAIPSGINLGTDWTSVSNDDTARTYVCNFDNVEQMSQAVPLNLNKKPLSAKATLEKRFRWFYTEYTFTEVFAGIGGNFPCEIVSGDWYWTARLGSKRILALGGSAKNGVPGALVSMLTVNALKDTVGQLSAMSSVSPSAILRTVQRKLPVVARNNAAGLSLCIFGRGSVRFAGVNQNAVLLKNGNTLVMRGDQPGDMFNTVTEGDVVMVYSASTRRELIARSTTPEMFCAALSQKTTVEQKGAIEELMSQKEQNEDVTIVSIII